MQTNEDIKESINILTQLATQLRFLRETWNTLYQNQLLIQNIRLPDHYSSATLRSATSSIIQNMMILKANAFLDEYNSKFNISRYPDNKDSIMRIKKVCRPILKKINKWSGIKPYRNEILGHNLRRNDVSLFTMESEYKLPYTSFDYLALCDLIFLIAEQFRFEFKEEILENTDRILNDNISNPRQNTCSVEELASIRVEVEKLRSETSQPQ